MTYTKQTWANGSAGGTPISATRLAYIEDGIEAAEWEAYGVSDIVTDGLTTYPRQLALASSGNMTAGTLNLMYFTAPKTFTAGNATAQTGGVGTTGATLIKYGIFSVAANGDLTLIGSTASDTALLTATFTSYTKALAAPVSFTKGNRYAFGMLIVGGTPGNHLGTTISAAEGGVAPRITGRVTGQTDLPSTVLAASVSTLNACLYGRLTA